jgi:hypothetical protein
LRGEDRERRERLCTPFLDLLEPWVLRLVRRLGIVLGEGGGRTKSNNCVADPGERIHETHRLAIHVTDIGCALSLA